MRGALGRAEGGAVVLVAVRTAVIEVRTRPITGPGGLTLQPGMSDPCAHPPGSMLAGLFADPGWWRSCSVRVPRRS
jgi:hypothetical protein